MPVAILGTQISLWFFDLRAIKKEQKPRFDVFAPGALTLWRVNAAQITSEISNEGLEDASTKIWTSFSWRSRKQRSSCISNLCLASRNQEIEELRAKLAALCVQLDYELGYAPPVEELDLSVPLSDTKLKRLKREKEYNETVNLGLKANPPSTSAKPSNFFQNQQKNPILNGRPLEHTCPPITIYNRTFGQFLEDFRNSDLVVPSDIMEWVVDIISVATDRYTIEGERMDTIREILSKKIGTISVISYGRKGCKSDGIRTAKVGFHDAYIGIFEGIDKLDLVELIPVFKEQYITEIFGLSHQLPSFIITIAGRKKDQVNQITRHFQALRLAFEQLSIFYQGSDLNQTGQRYFPYLRSFKSTEKNINFTYTEELADNHTRTIWKASTDNNKRIVVTEYNRDAHNICSSKGYASKLLYCSADNEIRALGGYKMIIMEYAGTSLDKKFDKLALLRQNSIYDDIKFAINLLHENNYVFADLRPPNILVL
ncbi:11819_t:CDS:2 [Funneliformis geosporum]|uniref:11819_t:CDS:1 n=1 Tax=Funneliformis geosporum TaxID=1117311 RepID=A0A9W4WQG5_9GLOM|nr:11819_t:CDS:2 [Funneliformis geosporum]